MSKKKNNTQGCLSVRDVRWDKVKTSFYFSLKQNDDGPDVRAGSGDILLVHATETDRKGACVCKCMYV